MPEGDIREEIICFLVPQINTIILLLIDNELDGLCPKYSGKDNKW